MSIFFLSVAIVFFVLFFVTLIEYFTGAEREGIKFFIFFFIFLLIVSFLATIKGSQETLLEKFAKLIAGLIDNFLK